MTGGARPGRARGVDAASEVPDTEVPGGARRSATPEELLRRLDELGIASRTFSHAPVFTVEEAKASRGELPGAHTKNLFLRDKKGSMWLVVALEDRAIDLRKLARLLGHRSFSFSSAERLMRYLGVAPGAVTPFGVVNDHERAVRVALDSGLLAHEIWNFHPLDNGRTTALRGADMVRFLDAVDHPPTWVDLGAVGGDGDGGR